MGLFKKAPSPHQTALAMVGARPGDRVLLGGRPDPPVVAELARITGLSGQTMLAAASGARGPYDAAAADAGVLVEMIEAGAGVDLLPETGDPHDVVVLHADLITIDQGMRDQIAARALSLLRPGGRVIVIEGRAPGGWFASKPPAVPEADVHGMLRRAGGHAVRTLGSVNGISYFEARKTR